MPINLGDAAPFSVYCRALACRIVVAVLACAILAFRIARQLVKSFTLIDERDTVNVFVRMQRETNAGNYSLRRADNDELQAVAVLTAIFSFAATVLSVLLVCVWWHLSVDDTLKRHSTSRCCASTVYAGTRGR